MVVTESVCGSILTRTTGYLKEVCSHSVNPYVGCGFGRSSCGEGCYVRFNHWITRGRDWGRFVDVKVNADVIYIQTCKRERRWTHRRSQKFSLFFSSATEPWQPAEKQYRITRKLLQAMCSEPPDEMILQTHSTGIREDYPLVSELHRSCDLRVHISIEGDRDRLPGLPPPPATVEDRIQVVRELTDAGIFTVVCLSPLTPLAEPEKFFEKLLCAGAGAVVIDHFIEGDGTRNGTRTLQTELPQAMSHVLPESVQLPYRDQIAKLAARYLPVGVSASGFAGEYSFPR